MCEYEFVCDGSDTNKRFYLGMSIAIKAQGLEKVVIKLLMTHIRAKFTYRLQSSNVENIAQLKMILLPKTSFP